MKTIVSLSPFVLSLFFSHASLCFGEDKNMQPFSNLEVLSVIKNSPNDLQIHYNKALSIEVLPPLSYDDFHDSESSAPILKTKISADDASLYIVGFSPGPSDDPTFIIYKDVKGSPPKELGRVFALHLYIPGNGSIYASGRINSFFDLRRKFVIINDQLVETKQPFYYVGDESETAQVVTLFNDIDGTDEVAQLPKGTIVQVLINAERNHTQYFLVKTPFGLIGWLKLGYPTPLKGIYFHGD